MKLRLNSLIAAHVPYTNEVTLYFTHPKFTRTCSGNAGWEVFVRGHGCRIVFITALYCAMVEDSVGRHIEIGSISQGESHHLVYSQYILAWYNFLAITKSNAEELAEMFRIVESTWKYAGIFKEYDQIRRQEETENARIASGLARSRTSSP